MKSESTIKAICFDVGNTLLCSTQSLRSFICNYIGQKKHFDYAYREFFQRQDLQLEIALASLCQELQIGDVHSDLFKKIQKEYIPKFTLFDDSITAFKQLGKYRIVTLSNVSSFEYTDLVSLGLNSIEKQFTSYELGVTKPDKQAFLAVQQYLNFLPSEILMVGDSIRSDLIGATSVGWKTVLVNRDKRILHSNEFTPVIHSLDVLHSIIAVL